MNRSSEIRGFDVVRATVEAGMGIVVTVFCARPLPGAIPC
jgi:hypothetical protein